jgi:hypothetical protein
MNLNFKPLSFGLIVSLSMGLASCGGDKKEDAGTENATTETAVEENTVDERVEFKFHYLTANIPSPVEIIDALPKSGIPFQKDLLNAKENEANYVTSMKKAMNFGVYALDMAYIAINEEYAMMNGYMVATRNLAKSLDLADVFDKVVAQRLSKNAENKDTLKVIFDDAFYEVDNYMRNNERALASTQILLGSWVESQFLTLNLVKSETRNEKNQALFDKIFEQKRHLESLVSLLSEYEKEKDFQPFIAKTRELNELYAALMLKDLDNKDMLAKMAAKTGELRAMIIK